MQSEELGRLDIFVLPNKKDEAGVNFGFRPLPTHRLDHLHLRRHHRCTHSFQEVLLCRLLKVVCTLMLGVIPMGRAIELLTFAGEHRERELFATCFKLTSLCKERHVSYTSKGRGHGFV